MEKLQMLDDACVFNPALPSFLGRFAPQMGSEHLVVGIIGAQSSGKSTLLNAVFGASFEVMDARAHRRQTTRGVWVSVLPTQRLTLLDIEGSDSRERWETKAAIERKTALLGLVLSNLLVINVWHREIGRFSANNYEIIRTVIEINLRDFTRDAPKKVVFAVRDFDERERLDAIGQLLVEDVQRLWGEVRKPPELATAPLNQVLEVEVVSLAHPKFNAEGFARDVAALRHRLLDRQANDYLFRGFRPQPLPFEAFATYARNVWEAVANNRDLDLPGQKLVVATYRADEIRKETLARSVRLLGELRGRVKDARVADLHAELRALRARSVNEFRSATVHYDPLAVGAAAQELSMALEEEELKLLKAIDEKKSEACLGQLDSALRTLLRSTDELPSLLAAALQHKGDAVRAHEDLLRQLELTAAQLPLFQHIFSLRVDAALTRFLASNADRLLGRWRRQIEREVEERIFECFVDVSLASWSRLNGALSERLTALSEQCLCLQQSTELCAVFSATVMSAFQRETLSAIKRILRAKRVGIPAALLKTFKRRFEVGEGGGRRNWHKLPDAEIERLFRAARASLEAGVALLEQALVLTWDGEVVASGEELAPLREDVLAMFDQQLEAAFAMKYNRNSMERVPPWLWIVLAYFMHDNILGWLASPSIVFFFLLAAAGIAYLAITGRGHAALAVVQLACAPMVDGLFRVVSGWGVGREEAGKRMQ